MIERYLTLCRRHRFSSFHKSDERSIVVDDDGCRFIRYRKCICEFMYMLANDEWINEISEEDVVIIEERLHSE